MTSMEWKAAQAPEKGNASAPNSKKPTKVDAPTQKLMKVVAPNQPDISTTTTGENRKIDHMRMLKEAREILDKQSLMGEWEKNTDKSLTFAMKQMDNKYGIKMPPDFRKAFLTVMVCLPHAVHSDQSKVNKAVVGIAKDIAKVVAEKIEMQINSGIHQLEAAVSKIQIIAADASKNLDEVAKNSSNLNTAVNTYKDALLAPTVVVSPQNRAQATQQDRSIEEQRIQEMLRGKQDRYY